MCGIRPAIVVDHIGHGVASGHRMGAICHHHRKFHRSEDHRCLLNIVVLKLEIGHFGNHTRLIYDGSALAAAVGMITMTTVAMASLSSLPRVHVTIPAARSQSPWLVTTDSTASPLVSRERDQVDAVWEIANQGDPCGIKQAVVGCYKGVG